jgi:hypothetical protein
MKAKSSIVMDFMVKSSLVLACFVFGFSSLTKGNAQGIVGKWKQVSAKMFCTPDAVKNSHGHLKDVMDMPKVEAMDEFKSDNTLTETITSGTTKTSASGTWTMLGKTVTISITGHKPMNGIISETGNTLIYTMDMPKSDHMQVSKREWTFSRI